MACLSAAVSPVLCGLAGVGRDRGGPHANADSEASRSWFSPALTQQLPGSLRSVGARPWPAAVDGSSPSTGVAGGHAQDECCCWRRVGDLASASAWGSPPAVSATVRAGSQDADEISDDGGAGMTRSNDQRGVGTLMIFRTGHARLAATNNGTSTSSLTSQKTSRLCRIPAGDATSQAEVGRTLQLGPMR